jgi:hypothetical protein
MPYVGYTYVANQANTSDGSALNASAVNVIGTGVGTEVGDTGVVDLYGVTALLRNYIADETAPGLVLQEDTCKIVLESS